MKNRYNIALIPTTTAGSVIECSRKFAAISGDYLLGDESLPHVTIYQFTAEEDEISLILEKLETSEISKSIDLEFADFSCISFDNITYWASLMPDKVSELNQMHRLVAELLGKPIKRTFDPHMTLMSTKDRNYEQLVDDVKKRYRNIRDTFVLSLGCADEVGQYLKIIYAFNDRITHRNQIKF